MRWSGPLLTPPHAATSRHAGRTRASSGQVFPEEARPARAGEGGWTLSHRPQPRPRPPGLSGRSGVRDRPGSTGSGCPSLPPESWAAPAPGHGAGLPAYSAAQPRAASRVRPGSSPASAATANSPLRGGRGRAAATAQVPAGCRGGGGPVLCSGSGHVASGETPADTWGEHGPASRFLLPTMPRPGAARARPLRRSIHAGR